MNYMDKKLSLFNSNITAMRNTADVTHVATILLNLFKDMDRFRTETAYMLRKGDLSFTADHQPSAEPLPDVRARVLCAALNFTPSALAFGTPQKIYALTAGSDRGRVSRFGDRYRRRGALDNLSEPGEQGSVHVS